MAAMDSESGEASTTRWPLYVAVEGDTDGANVRRLHIELARTRGRCSNLKVPLLAGVLGLAALAVLVVQRRFSSSGQGFASQSNVEMYEEKYCGVIEDDLEYHTEIALRNVHNVSSPEQCCAQCEAEPDCGAWVWGKLRDSPGVTDVCFLKGLHHSRELKTLERRGVVSGLPSSRIKKHGFVASQQQHRAHGQEADVTADAACPGSISVRGFSNVSVSAAAWTLPQQRARRVEVLESSWVLPHVRSRAYWTKNCTSASQHSQDFVRLHLLGKTLRYTADLSGAGCGCNAALKLVPLGQDSVDSDCPDGYCDAHGTCGASCAEVALQQANEYAWSSSVHIQGDKEGVNIGYPGTGTQHPGKWTGTNYGPGGECIDTSAPFDVKVSFPTDDSGALTSMQVTLSQSGRSCQLHDEIKGDTVQGRTSWKEEVQKLLEGGLTPAISYTSSKQLGWLDGLRKDGSGPCAMDAPDACVDTVRFYDFAIDPIKGSAPAHPSAIAQNPVQLAIGDMLEFDDNPPSEGHVAKNGHGSRTSNRTHKEVDHHSATQEALGLQEWEVVSDAVAVSSSASGSAAALGFKYRGMIVLGHQEDDWLALDYEPGFIKISRGSLRKRTVTYSIISEGSCSDHGSFPILDPLACRAAGIRLGYLDTKVRNAPNGLKRPEGCYLLNGELWLSMSPSNVGRGKVGTRTPICSSVESATSTSTTTITTTQTKTSTTETLTTTTQWVPTLFCWSVITMKTYEPSVIRVIMKNEAGIFACDAWKIFSETGGAHVGDFEDGTPVMTTSILQLPDNMKNRGSFASLTGATCFNTETFLRTWHTIVQQNLYAAQDWTVKVDPDAVFMPQRLALKLVTHTPPGGSPQYLKNCNRFGLGPRMFGAVEVYSRKAVDSYKWGELSCIDFPWKGWGEDYFMEKCLDKLGVAWLQEFGWVADERCSPAPCSDPSKVAFHAFKNLGAYSNCLDQAVQADK